VSKGEEGSKCRLQVKVGSYQLIYTGRLGVAAARTDRADLDWMKKMLVGAWMMD